MLFDAGADVVTVLAVASSSTFDAVDRVARRRSAQVIADTIVSPDPFAALAEDYPSTVTGVALHVPHDQRAAGTASAGSLVASVLPAPLGRDLVLAGGIDLASLDLLLALEPDVLVVGRAITAAPDPVAAARAIAERVR
jgi:3-keto-L-gulonate-6-phosphate decarboxylase